jgi:subtilisin family serine protease
VLVRLAAPLLVAALAAAAATVQISGSALAAESPRADTAAGSVDAKVDPEVYADLAASKGETTFYVMLADKADLSGAKEVRNHAARGEFVVEQLTRTAEASQAPLRELLRSRGVFFKPFWVVNAIQVVGDLALVKELATRPDVKLIFAEEEYPLPRPTTSSPLPRINAVEWGVDRVKAPQVWALGATGAGIVVASIDSGAQFDHPALVGKYRGNLGGGTFNHNYNWHDPSSVCGSPSNFPCDNNGHGTHVTGTMVGDDGGENQIGVAPGARWIAAKGCESSSCSTSALLSSGQWILAPTNLSGTSPNPALRPHIVNNSWGGGASSDPWYQATVQAWIASGIFPQFANGNSGPACGTAGNPGNTPEAYSAGAFDVSDAIWSSSSRGASAWGGIVKPNIAAPGVAVRSSVPTNGYSSFNGTSMASPHVSGAIALVWSAAPAIVREIDTTKALLNQTAIDTSDLSCGGTPGNNNVWGEGRLDALAAYNAAAHGAVGKLPRTVTSGGSPVASAVISATGAMSKTVTTNASGAYSMTLIGGSYTITASKFGLVSQSAPATIVAGATTPLSFSLAVAPTFTVSGTVRDASGSPLEGAVVTVDGTPLAPATASAAGNYAIANVPQGTYDMTATGGRCNSPVTHSVTVSSATTRNFSLPSRTDTFGHRCALETAAFEEASTVLPIAGDDVSGTVALPFPFTFYGTSYTSVSVCTNGFISFTTTTCAFSNTNLPTTAAPNGAIYAYWDDLVVDGSASIRGETKGSAPNRRFVIEFRNLHFWNATAKRVGFNIVLHENGHIQTQYRDIANDAQERGNSATVGIENPAGNDALLYSFNEAVLDTGMTIRFRRGGAPASPFLDFDGDGDSDIALFRPSNGAWYVRGMLPQGWGTSTDVPVPADYDGDGVTDLAVFRPSTGGWHIRGVGTFGYGTSTDIPVPGDYDGDGIADLAIYRPSTGGWHIRGIGVFGFGVSTDIPVPGDYDGDGVTDIAVFRPSNGGWYIRGQGVIGHGASGDIPVPGDYGGDGVTDIAVFRPSNGGWYIRGQGVIGHGLSTDIPVPADYDGDGTTDIAVFRPSNGGWYIRGQSVIGFGTGSDKVLALPFAVRRAFYP